MAKQTTAAPPVAPVKKPKHRSPNYPAMGLEAALAKAKMLHDEYKRHNVPLGTAMEKMGYKVDSSSGQQTVAALRYFGLAEDEGSGDKRQVRVSERAAKILGGHSDRVRLLQEAALLPPIHKEVWDKFYKGDDGLAPDATIKQYLQWDREGAKFNPEALDPFIAAFKQTIGFANLDSSGKLSDEVAVPKTDPPVKDRVRIGDWVQWTSQGVAQFPQPRQVARIDEHDCQKFVFVVGDDGKEGAVPMDQVTVEQPPDGFGRGRESPFKPPAISPRVADEPNTEESRWKLPSGHAVLRYPSKMNARDFKVLKQQIELLEFSLADEADAE